MATEDGSEEQIDFTPKPLGSLFGTPDAQYQSDDDDEGEVQGKVDEGSEGAKSGDESDDSAGTPEKPEDESDDTGNKAEGSETGEGDGSPPSGDDKDEKLVPLAVVHAERDRRKAAESELEALKAEGTPAADTQTPKISLPSIYDGEGDFQEGIIKLVTTTARQEVFNDRLKSSQAKAIEEFGEEKVQKALDRMTPEMKINPKFVDRFRQAQEPFMEIVQMAEDLDKAEKMADPDYVSNWEKEKEAEIEKRVRAELEGKAKKESDLDDAIPDSLAGSRSTGDLKAGVPYSGPKPLAEIFAS